MHAHSRFILKHNNVFIGSHLYCYRACNSESFELAFSDLKAQLNVSNAKLSELQIKLDDMKTAQEREQRARDDLHAHYQQRLRENQAEIEAFKK